MSKTRLRLTSLAVALGLILIFVLGLAALTTRALADEEEDPTIGWTETQLAVHEIAELARAAGLPADSPIFAECSRIWWEEEAAKAARPEPEEPEEYPIAREVWDYLHNCGLSDAVSAGIIGNMMAECGGQTLALEPGVYGGGGSYYGLCQWSRTYYPQVQGADVETQMQTLMDTIEGTINGFGGSYSYFCSIGSAYDAAVYFCQYYERGAGTGTRGRNAEAALAYFAP